MAKKDVNRLKIMLAVTKRSNKWLAEMLGKDQATISKWCTNTCQPDLETLIRISDLLKVDVNDLLNKECIKNDGRYIETDKGWRGVGGAVKGTHSHQYDIACELVAFRMYLFNNAIYLLPYTGVGSGITRALDEDVNVTFMNNDNIAKYITSLVAAGYLQMTNPNNPTASNQIYKKVNIR